MASVEVRYSTSGTKRYRIKFREGGGNGPWQSETLTSKAAAATFKQAVEEAGHYWPPEWDRVHRRWKTKNTTDGRMVTLDQWASEWLEGLSGVAERTRHDYQRDLRLHIRPAFGQTYLDELTPIDVSKWVNRLEAAGKAPKTIANVHGLLFQLMRDAAEQGLRSGNPCARTRLPRQDHLTNEAVVFLSPQELEMVLAHCGPARDLFTVMAATGLRWAEAAALQVGDVDLLAQPPTISVQRAWKRLPSGKGRVLGPPKTRRSRRSVPIPDYLVERLIPLVQRSGKDFLLLAPGGLAWHYTPAQRTWNRAVLLARQCDTHRGAKPMLGPCDPLECVGVLDKQPTIKTTRHSHAAMLISAGLPLTLVQRRLGHESIQTSSDTYGHLSPEVDLRAVAELQRVLGPDAAAVGLGL